MSVNNLDHSLFIYKNLLKIFEKNYRDILINTHTIVYT